MEVQVLSSASKAPATRAFLRHPLHSSGRRVRQLDATSIRLLRQVGDGMDESQAQARVLKTLRTPAQKAQHHRQRACPPGHRDPGHAAALRAPQRAAPVRAALRLRARAVRRLHGAPHGTPIRSCVTPVAGVSAARSRRSRGWPRLRRAEARRQAASGPAGLDRRAGAAVRLLPERLDDVQRRVLRRRPARRTPRSETRCGHQVPLRDARVDPARRQARPAKVMASMTEIESTTFTRAHVRQGQRRAGRRVLAVRWRRRRAGTRSEHGRQWPQPSLTAVDSFLELHADGTVIAKVGKGTGSMGLTRRSGSSSPRSSTSRSTASRSWSATRS